MSSEDRLHRLSPRRRGSRLPKLTCSAQSKTALSSSPHVPANCTKNTVISDPLAASKSSRILRTLPNSQDPHYWSPFKQEVNDKPKHPPDTNPEYITWLWNLVAEKILVPTTMEMAPTVDVPASKNFLDAQNFNYPEIQIILNQYGITIADDVNLEIWTVFTEIKNRIKTKVEGKKTEYISGANALVSSNETTLNINNHWVEEGTQDIGRNTQNTTGNNALVLLTEILPVINHRDVHKSINMELPGPICDIREVLRKHILLGRELKKGKGAVLARISTSEFRLKDSEHRVETFQHPPPLGQFSVSPKIARGPPHVAATSTSTTLSKISPKTHSHKPTSNLEHESGCPGSQKSLAKVNKSTVSQLVTSIPSLPLPSGMLDFQYALDPNAIIEAVTSRCISKCTFVTDREVATCPFFSIVFDDFPNTGMVDSSKQMSFLKAKFAVLAASALWNRLRLREKSRTAKKEQLIDVSQSDFLHFGLAVTGSDYIFLLAKVNTEGEWREGNNWTGCKIATCQNGCLEFLEHVKQLYIFVDRVLEWGSSAWKDEVIEDLALIIGEV